MLKTIILVIFLLLFTALVWALGLIPEEEETLLKYLVFASQLLYGNMCHDLVKSMRVIPSDDKFWPSILRTIGEASAWMVATIISLLLAVKVFLFAFVGLIAAAIFYGIIFVRVLPRLQPLYLQAIERVPKKPL